MLSHWSGQKQNFFKTKFGEFLTNLGVSRRFQPAIYTVSQQESESEVQNAKILQANPQNVDFMFFIFIVIFKPDQVVKHAIYIPLYSF